MSKFYYFVLLLVASSLVNAQQDDGVTEEIVVSSVGQKTANEIISSIDIIDHTSLDLSLIHI